MKCLETRKRNGMKWRRYVTEDGLRVVTYEVPESVLKYLSRATLSLALKRHNDGLKRRARDAQIHKLLREGWKTTAVASKFNLSDSMVRRIKQGMRDGRSP